MPILWYCCGCRFGPHNAALYDACINCGSKRCGLCTDEKVARHANETYQDSYETSPYPSVITLDTNHTLSLDAIKVPSTKSTDIESPETVFSRPQHSTTLPSRLGISQSYSQTYMYICCKCQDGPKVYNVQPVCVVCNHEACYCCTYVK